MVEGVRSECSCPCHVIQANIGAAKQISLPPPSQSPLGRGNGPVLAGPHTNEIGLEFRDQAEDTEKDACHGIHRVVPKLSDTDSCGFD